MYSSFHVCINRLAGSFSQAEYPPPPESGHSTSKSQTIAFSNNLASAISKIAQVERADEEERRTKREKRASNDGLLVEGGRSNSVSLGSSGTVSGLTGERVPDVDFKKSISKKEQKRQADAKATEAQLHAAANKTANMSLSLGGSLGKALSWMNPNRPVENGGFPVPSRATTGSHGQSKAANGVGSGHSVHKTSGKTLGDFREDKGTGAGIQLRDVIGVLEPEPKERKALAKAFGKLATKPRSSI